MPNFAQPQGPNTPPINQPTGGTYYGYNTQIGNGALPQGIQGTQNRAYTRDVQGSELAAQQLANITSQNSPLMRNAAMQGLRRAGARGMLNSSMSSEAAQNAVIENAAPIALSDADAYRAAAGENLQYLNQRDIANMQNQTNLAQISSQEGIERMGNEAALQRQRENLAYSGEQEELARRYGFNMAGLNNQFATEADYRNYGFDLGRANQGYQQDLGRMGAAYGYDQMGLDAGIRRDVYADQYSRTQNYFDELMNRALDDPDIFDPQTISNLYSVYNRYMSGSNPALDNILGIGG